jgi:hypothetical protein
MSDMKRREFIALTSGAAVAPPPAARAAAAGYTRDRVSSQRNGLGGE